MYDVIIAGAGPTGCYLGSLLARRNLNILILEEHEEVGKPEHCAGIVSKKLFSEFNLKTDSILDEINSVKVCFPDNTRLSLPTSITPLVLDRAKFDKELSIEAQQSGCQIFFNHKVIQVENSQNHTLVTVQTGSETKFFKSKLTVVATGAMSALPYKLCMADKTHNYKSAQLEAQIKDIQGIELFVGSEIAPGTFGYAVKIDEYRAKIGMITRNNIVSYFENFLENSILSSRITKKITTPQYRSMPFCLPKTTALGRIITVGDAARQIKTTTGGGVYYGIRCANILAEIINSADNGNDFNTSILKKYDKKWKNELRKELTMGLAIRKLLENVDDHWWNKVGSTLQKPEIASLVQQYRDFDHHHEFIFSFFRNPAIGKLLLDLIRQNINNGEALINFWTCC